MPIARETSTQWPPGPATSSDGMQNSPRIVSALAIANSAPTSTMFIVSRPQPRSTKSFSAGASTSAAERPGAYAPWKAWKPSVLIRTLSRTDSSSSSLLTARAWSKATSQLTSSAWSSSASWSRTVIT